MEREDIDMASCISTNPVVRNAMDEAAGNASPVKAGRYEVTLETVTLKGSTTATATMTDAQLKAWLGLIHSSGVHEAAVGEFAKGKRYYMANLDMHPTVHIRPM